MWPIFQNVTNKVLQNQRFKTKNIKKGRKLLISKLVFFSFFVLSILAKRSDVAKRSVIFNFDRLSQNYKSLNQILSLSDILRQKSCILKKKSKQKRLTKKTKLFWKMYLLLIFLVKNNDLNIPYRTWADHQVEFFYKISPNFVQNLTWWSAHVLSS
jgi:hypothetical protein